MLHGMDWWTFGVADASIASTWFGLRHARLKVVVLQRTVVSSLSCSIFEFWVLRFRDLGASFSSASFSKLPNFDLGNTVYISSQAFYAGVDPFDDFE